MRRGLGRERPSDFKHVEKYPYKTLAPASVTVAEKRLPLPYWHWKHDQGMEGSCVGHAAAMERAITNRAQAVLNRIPGPWVRRYDPLHIWNEAKVIDEWPETNPGDDHGTSVRAAYDILRDVGPRRIKTNGIALSGGHPAVSDTARLPDPADGVSTNRWATSVDEIRTAIAADRLPVVIGVDWYSSFDHPQQRGREWWLATPERLGVWRGGHAVVLYGASDRRQAFALKNSWGRDYPLVWLPYATMAVLLQYDGEAALVTDR
jgi:hypothetical protein